MAAELCRVSLWLEAIEPGKPLSFLEHRIQCGNSLLGVTPALLAKGIPDEAFTPIEGDDKEICREFKRVNKTSITARGAFLRRRPNLGSSLEIWRSSLANLDAVADDSLEGIREKQRIYEETIRSADYLERPVLGGCVVRRVCLEENAGIQLSDYGRGLPPHRAQPSRS